MNISRNRRQAGRRFVAAAVVSTLSLVPVNLLRPAVPAGTGTVHEGSAAVADGLDSLSGRSGKVRIVLVPDERDGAGAAMARLFGDSAARRPGLYASGEPGRDGSFTFARLVPFTAKRDGMLGRYRMGFWPAEGRPPRSASYRNPAGFIEVTPGNQDTRVSEHFRLRDFLTRDQAPVWPKYLVLEVSLVDKLELLIEELAAAGTRVSRMSVMSGFRTPQYNERGVGAGGRARDSRHQYGDAADVFVDDDGDGRMDDLTGDGRVNSQDARYLAQLVERVERRFPELVGGVGVYAATDAHGPFVHVDVRGVRARW